MRPIRNISISNFFLQVINDIEIAATIVKINYYQINNNYRSLAILRASPRI